MRKIALVLLLIISAVAVSAQQRVIDEVKKSISNLSLTIPNYQNALGKLKPALTHADTRNSAEAWYLAGKINFALYDKFQVSKSIGNKIDDKTAAHILLDAYDCDTLALQLDSIKETNRDGSHKIDNKTGKIKVKTKYSKEIVKRIGDHVLDFRYAGGDLYNCGDWNGAYRAWDIYCNVTRSQFGAMKTDTIVGLIRFYQGLAAYQAQHYDNAVLCYDKAKELGYKQKILYDNKLNALVKLNDTLNVASTALEAYRLYGNQDLQYIKILINDHLSNHRYELASQLLDEAIDKDSSNAAYYDLKGNIIEQQNDIEQAIKFYEQSVMLQPDYDLALYDLGRAYYLKALQYMKDNPGLSRKRITKEVYPIYRNSASYLEKAYALMPQNEDVKEILKSIYYNLGEGKKLQALEKSK